MTPAPMLPCSRVLLLLGPGGKRKRYPIPGKADIADEYLIDGITYRVVMVMNEPMQTDLSVFRHGHP